MAERYGRGPLSLPIDYLQVGLLRDRTSTPMGLLTLDAGATLTSEQFLHKVKTVALRQLPVAASVPAQDIEVFVKWARLSGGVLLHAGYIGPLTTPVTDDVDAFVRNVCVYNKPLQVEVWKKSDLGSPSHCYQRSTRPMLYFSAAQTPAPAFATVKVEATQLEDSAKPAPTVRHFSAPLLTAQCVRAFRKDLDRQVLAAAGVRDTDNTKVDIYFKIKGAAQKDASSKTGKSKESFEEGVLACIAKRKPIKIQFRIRSTQEASKKCRDDVTSTATQPVVPPKPLVQAADKSADGFSFGAKTAFDRQPASTSPAPVSLPSAGSAFDQFSRAEPLRMSSAGSATSFRTLHEGFYESVRQAAAVHSPAPKTPPMASESQRTIKTETNAQKVPALRQVESLLSSFLLNLNKTLLDNFGDSASTLTLSDTTKHKAQSSKTPAGQSGVRHNATCNLCKAVVVGTRHKCANCPDWDCCDKCRSMAAQLHPGHLLMAIDSLSVIRGSVRSKNLSRHRNILCDGCDEPIVGPRFKCIACDDFDWCDNCEADPVKRHDKGDHHVFLKINRPLADSERVAHFALQGRALVQEMQCSLGREEEPSLRQREEMQQVRDSTTTLASRDSAAAVASASAPTPTQEVRAEEPARLSPDPFQEAVEAIKADIKKRSLRTGEDDLLHGAENKRVATEKFMEEEKSTEKSTTETDMDDIQKRLAALSSDAQKLPGSDYVPANSPIKVASSPNDEDREEYDMRVLGDVNMPDGTAVVAGSQFEKVWSVKNTGRKTWPASTAIQLTSSSGGIQESAVCCPIGKTVSPGDTAQVAVGDLEAGESLGDHHLYFRLQLPGVGGGQGKRFGQQLWCQVHVVDGSGANSMGASSYLSATNDKGAVNKDERQGSGALSEHWAGSSLGSSLFQLPNAPESVAATSERDQGPITSATTTTTDTDDVDDLSFASSDDDGDDDYEIIDPTSSDDDTDEP